MVELGSGGSGMHRELEFVSITEKVRLEVGEAVSHLDSSGKSLQAGC